MPSWLLGVIQSFFSTMRSVFENCSFTSISISNFRIKFHFQESLRIFFGEFIRHTLIAVDIIFSRQGSLASRSLSHIIEGCPPAFCLLAENSIIWLFKQWDTLLDIFIDFLFKVQINPVNFWDCANHNFAIKDSFILSSNVYLELVLSLRDVSSWTNKVPDLVTFTRERQALSKSTVKAARWSRKL